MRACIYSRNTGIPSLTPLHLYLSRFLINVYDASFRASFSNLSRTERLLLSLSLSLFTLCDQFEQRDRVEKKRRAPPPSLFAIGSFNRPRLFFSLSLREEKERESIDSCEENSSETGIERRFSSIRHSQGSNDVFIILCTRVI